MVKVGVTVTDDVTVTVGVTVGVLVRVGVGVSVANRALNGLLGPVSHMTSRAIPARTSKPAMNR